MEIEKWGETQIRTMCIPILPWEGKDKASERTLKQMRTEMNVWRWGKEGRSEEGEEREKGRKIASTYQVSVTQNLNFNSSLLDSRKTHSGFESPGGNDLMSKSFQSERERTSRQAPGRNAKPLLVDAVPCAGPGLQTKLSGFGAGNDADARDRPSVLWFFESSIKI